MSTIKSFEDLICWQKARNLTKFVYDISKYRNFQSDRGLVDQIRRAAVSVMSNIAEGFDRGTKLEFLNYLFIAKGSCGEVRAQLYVAYDSEYIDISKFKEGLRLTDECSRLLQSFIEKVKTSSQSGLQYKREIKKDTWFRDYLNENNLVQTSQGVMSLDRARVENAEIIEDS